MKIETPIILETKIAEYKKLAAVSDAVNALITAQSLTKYPIEELGEIITSMAIRRIRKDMPAYKRK